MPRSKRSHRLRCNIFGQPKPKIDIIIDDGVEIIIIDVKKTSGFNSANFDAFIAPSLDRSNRAERLSENAFLSLMRDTPESRVGQLFRDVNEN